MAVKGYGNKLRYEDEIEREKAREFRKIVAEYEEYINVYNSYNPIFYDRIELDGHELQEEFFLKVYRKNKDLDVKQFTDKLMKKMGFMQLRTFLEKRGKVIEKRNLKEYKKYEESLR